MYQASDELRCVCFLFGEDGYLGHYVLLINDKRKEYMIVYVDYLEQDQFNNEDKFKFVSKDVYVDLVRELVNNNYSIISFSEDWYYEDSLYLMQNK